MTQDIIVVAVGAVICYLLGSVNFAVIFSYLFEKKDVRKMGSGNAGMTNVMRSIGVLPGILTFVGDFLKGLCSVAVGRYLLHCGWFGSFDTEFLLPVFTAYICGVACQLGHIFPIFMGFKGGKGVATSIGILFMLDWRAAIVAVTVFAIMMLATRIVSVSSIIATVTAPFSIYGFHRGEDSVVLQVILCTALVVTIVLAHKQNIVRIFKGEEKKLSIKGSGSKATEADK